VDPGPKRTRAKASTRVITAAGIDIAAELVTNRARPSHSLRVVNEAG